SWYGPTIIKCPRDYNRSLMQPRLKYGQECPRPPPDKIKIRCPRDFGPARGNRHIEPQLSQNVDILFIILRMFEHAPIGDGRKKTHTHISFTCQSSGVCRLPAHFRAM